MSCTHLSKVAGWVPWASGKVVGVTAMVHPAETFLDDAFIVNSKPKCHTVGSVWGEAAETYVAEVQQIGTIPS